MDLICKINFTFLKHTLIYTRTLHIHGSITSLTNSPSTPLTTKTN